MQSDDITQRVALLALQNISTASSINQILTIISALATNIDEIEDLDRDRVVRSAVENTYSLSVQYIMQQTDHIICGHCCHLSWNMSVG